MRPGVYAVREVSTASAPGSPRGHPAWGGGCDRVLTRLQQNEHIAPHAKMPRLIVAAFLFVCPAPTAFSWSADVPSAFLFRNSEIRDSEFAILICLPSVSRREAALEK